MDPLCLIIQGFRSGVNCSSLASVHCTIEVISRVERRDETVAVDQQICSHSPLTFNWENLSVRTPREQQGLCKCPAASGETPLLQPLKSSLTQKILLIPGGTMGKPYPHLGLCFSIWKMGLVTQATHSQGSGAWFSPVYRGWKMCRVNVLGAGWASRDSRELGGEMAQSRLAPVSFLPATGAYVSPIGSEHLGPRRESGPFFSQGYMPAPSLCPSSVRIEFDPSWTPVQANPCYTLWKSGPRCFFPSPPKDPFQSLGCALLPLALG